jgi:uncharacterized protein (TIGR02271 family)
MITQEQVRDVIGQPVLSTDGDKLGKAGQVFLDDQTNQPEWVTVNTGLFGSKESFVPLAQAQLAADGITVPYSKDQIKNAPSVDIDGGHLDQAEEAALYAHYGLDYTESRSDSGLPEAGTDTGYQGAVGRDTSGPTTDDAMTRSEERLRAGTEKVTTGKARLRKYVETEQQQVSVPITKEKVRLETEPITDANIGNAMAGPALSEEEHEVTLTEERPVIAKETVPVERVRLTKDVEQTEETVTAEVGKERIETDATDTDINLNTSEPTRPR